MKQLSDARAEMLGHRRRIIANNDGCDCLYFPSNEKVTVQEFLDKRTTDLADKQVDTIAYCTISSGFSHFTHNTKVGTLFTRQGADYGILPQMRNITADLVELGTDALRPVVEFGHRHQMEVFWSMRMNDTHDVAHRPGKPYFLYPHLKEEHPDWLVGDCVKRTPFGRWSSVDYARPEIRGLAFQYIEEVCKNYDVDGIEMDYFRHLCYFKSVAFGGKASEQEREWMTEFMRRTRRMTEQVGCQRGRPILISIRVPDSIGYCRDMGFDIETWLKEGLVDILVTTGYFQLNPWEQSVQLGHTYGVRVYPCLSDSRVRGESRFRRSSIESYRGRASNAWLAGADGLHLFNYFNPNSPIWSELGEPATLRKLDKLFFVTVRDGDPSRFLADGAHYRSIPILTPGRPAGLSADHAFKTSLVIGDDLAAARSAGLSPTVKLHLETMLVQDPDTVAVKLNGQILQRSGATKGWFDYDVPIDFARQGTNAVEVSLASAPVATEKWSLVYDGKSIPRQPWSRDPGSARATARLVDGSLMIADRGTVSGDYLYYRCQWGVTPAAETTVEAEVKVVSGGSYLIMANGESGERLELAPGYIRLYHHRNLRYDMDTIGEFHQYRVVLKGQGLKVYVDGTERIDARGVLKARGGYPRNELGFGAANSTDVGAAYWKCVRVRTTNASCRDIVVRVKYVK